MNKAKILIVEDEIVIAMEIKGMLTNLGYEVISVVNSGEKAIQKIEENKPDLVLMDIRIKGEKDGIETAEIIRQNFGIPVVFATAYLDQDKLDRAKITMPFGYVLKPIQERELRVTIEMALYVGKLNLEKDNALKALKQNEEKFRLLYERAPMSYQSLDENGCFKDVNATWLKTLGYTRDEVIGKSFGDFIHPEWREHFKENFPQFKRMGEILGVEFEMVKRDGSLILVSFHGKIGYDNEGRFEKTHCIFKEITSERKIQEDLQDENQRFRLLIENIDDLACEVDAAGNYIYVNQRYLEVLGYRPEELIGCAAKNHLHPDHLDESQPKFRKLVESGDTRKDIWRFRHKNGEWLWFECNAQTYQKQNGETRVLVISKQLDESEIVKEQD